MLPALPSPVKLKTNQQSSVFSEDDFGRVDHLLVIARKGDARALADQPALGRFAERLKGSEKTTVTLAAGDCLVTVARVADDATPFEMLEAARKWVAAVRTSRKNVVGLAFDGLDTSQCHALAEAVYAAALAAEFNLPRIGAENEAEQRLHELRVFGVEGALDFKRTEATAEGNNLARWLATMPGNYLTPAKYRKYIETLAESFGWEAEFLDEPTLKKKRAGAFIAVVQGSEDRDAGIMRLRYKPGKATDAPPVALVGKGICFDTGGHNLKGGKGMFGMHGDMQGSAVALGTLVALSRLEVDFPVECWLALAQNHIGPKAYKMNDVITASDGTTIEILHTDAEGRMVLADTLALASSEKPAFIMDFATLTGTCVYSLGTRYSGIFMNRDDLMDDLIAAGRRSGERVWPFPQDRDYDELLESKVADIKQCLIEGEADHILAGRFLNRFVKNDVPWVHVDLAASESKGGLAHVPSEFTGFGVRFASEYLLNRRG